MVKVQAVKKTSLKGPVAGDVEVVAKEKRPIGPASHPSRELGSIVCARDEFRQLELWLLTKAGGMWLEGMMSCIRFRVQSVVRTALAKTVFLFSLPSFRGLCICVVGKTARVTVCVMDRRMGMGFAALTKAGLGFDVSFAGLVCTRGEASRFWTEMERRITEGE